MKILLTFVLWPIHAALIVVWPLVLVGVIRRTKAMAACRRGPPLFQAFFDLVKLGKKGEVLADTTTWVFHSAPWVSFGVVLAVGMLVPTCSIWSPLAGQADLILLVYLLGLERFYRTIAALDTGTAFAGLGASRESFISSLSEPALVLSLWCTGLLTGTLYIPEMVSQFSRRALLELSPAYLLVLLPLLFVTLAEKDRKSVV
jgi:formate hydrogenlyase subunit 4